MPTLIYLWLGANAVGVLIYARLCFIMGHMMRQTGPDGRPVQDIEMYYQEHQITLLAVFLVANCMVLALGLLRGAPRVKDRVAGIFFVVALVWIWIYAKDDTLILMAQR